MDWNPHLFERIGALAMVGPLAIPIWLGFLFVMLSFLRGPLLSLIFALLHIVDSDLAATCRKRIDTPTQSLFLGLALMPFLFLVQPPYNKLATLVVHIFTISMFLHIVIQSVDLTIFSWYLKKTRANVSAVIRFFTLTVLYGIAVMLVLDWELSVSILPLLATSTVLTAVLGLALQDTLKNAFAGLNMSLENSFEQGDWVLFRLDSTDQWVGQIVEIGWRTTKIKTLNNNYAIIPNSTFTSHELVNYNKPTSVHGRTINLPVPLTAEPDHVGPALMKAALSVNGVLSDPKPEALPIEMHQSHIMYQLRFWLSDIELRETLTGKVYERCWIELRDLGAVQK